MKANDLIEVKPLVLNNIPCLIVKPTFIQGDLPTLFHYHGWCSKKENHVFLARTIAYYGYQVILPDSNLHGERNALDNYGEENLKQYFWEVITQSVKEFQGIKKHAESILNINKKAIAVSGSSMGGFISSSIFAQDTSIKSLICFNGACAWIQSEKILKEKFGEEVSNKINLEEAKLFDPLTYKETLYPRSILMLHGDSDTSVPVEIQEYFYKEIAPLYEQDPERMQLKVHPNMNHHLIIRMVESAVVWLEKYLK